MPTDPNYHARLSPSGAHRWMHCPGSVVLEDGLTDDGNEYSDEGTCAHAIAAACLVTGKKATELVGQRVVVAPHRTYEFRADMAPPVQKYVDDVRGYEVSDVPTEPGVYSDKNEMHVEIDVPIDHLTGEEEATGRSDVVIITRDQNEIQGHDLKFGMGVRVEAFLNEQEMMYLLGALKKYDVMGEFKRARIVIHQPRLNSISEWDCTIEELLAFGEKVKVAAKRATDMLNKVIPIELVPGEDQCRFCKAKATCPALARKVVETVGADFEVLATHTKPKAAAEELVATSSHTMLRDKFKSLGLLEDFIKAVRAKVEAELFANNNSPEIIAALDVKLVEGRLGNRAWADAAAVEAAMKSFRLKQDEMYEFSLISPTTAEKLAPKYDKDGALVPGQDKTPIKDGQWKKLQPLIKRSPGQPSVAPASDKRPALVVKPIADEFAVLTGAEDLV